MSIAGTPHSTAKQESAEPTEASRKTASPGRTKGRSESSPAKVSPPVMKTPEVPKLNLARAPAEEMVAQSPALGKKVLPSSPVPAPKSPGSSSGAKAHVRFASSSVVLVSSSAPSTPRRKSRHADEALSPRRHHIEGSPRKTSDWRKREPDGGLNIVPSPRKLNDGLLHLGVEVARLIFSEMRAKTPLLTKATINQLGRFETPIPVDRLSPGLVARIPTDAGAKISHAKLIKAVFLPLLCDTEVGKTLLTMRRAVMEQYDGHTLTLVDREMREAEDPGFKDRLLMNIEEQGKACAAVALGIKATGLAASKLPAELIAFWKAMDAELCQWAKGNPELPAAELKKARANLGFDLLFTRLVLPLASGGKEDATLAIPSMFFDSVKRALLANWLVFVESFIGTVDSERQNTPDVPDASTASAPVSTADPVDGAITSHPAHPRAPVSTPDAAEAPDEREKQD